MRVEGPETIIESVDELLSRIEIDPAVMTGKAVIRGTRIPVDLILEKLAAGLSREEILRSYPRLVPEDVAAALLFAAESLRADSYIPLSGGDR